MTKRKQVYLIIFWLLTGLVLEALVFFSSINSFTDMTFSRDDEVYEVNEALLTFGQFEGDTYSFRCEVFFRDNDYDYLVLTLNDNAPENMVVDFESTNKKGELTEQITGIKVSSGENLIELKCSSFDYFSIMLTGAANNTIEGICFRQTAKDTSNPNAVLYMGIAAIIYIGLTILTIKAYQWKKGHRP